MGLNQKQADKYLPAKEITLNSLKYPFDYEYFG